MSAASANMSTPSLLPGSVAPAPNAPGHPMGEVSSAMYYTVAAILSVFCVLGTFFNGGALAVYWTHRPLRTPTNSFVIALCVCDLFMCLIGMPIPAGYAWARTSIRSRAVCLLDGFTVYFFSQSSLFLLAAISVDRYIVIVRPLIAPVITHRLAGMAIAVCFLLGLFWAAVPMLGWNRYVLEGIGVACSVSWQPGPDAGHTSYILAIFVCCFLLPLLAITFCYVGIYRAIRAMGRNSGWGATSQLAHNNYQLERKMLRTVVVMIAGFLVSWMPYTVLGLTGTVQGGLVVGAEVETFPALLAKLSAVWDPLIYLATNLQFRHAFFDLCPGCEAVLTLCVPGGGRGGGGVTDRHGPGVTRRDPRHAQCAPGPGRPIHATRLGARGRRLSGQHHPGNVREAREGWGGE